MDTTRTAQVRTVQQAEHSDTVTAGNFLQRKCACGQHTIAGGECAECRQKREGMIQRAAVSAAAMNGVPPIVHEVLSSPGQPLDAGTRAFMEPRFGHDFSQVRVHTNARAAESARAMNALAYTVGRDVVFGAGQYASGMMTGRKLLAHELTHVVQQRSMRNNTTVQEKLKVGQPDDIYEPEAELNANRVMRTTRVSVRHHSDTSMVQTQMSSAGTPEPASGKEKEKTGKCSKTSKQNCTDEDLLTAVCIGEAGNIHDSDGKKGVINVAMNRFLDGSFGSTILAVVQPLSQFKGLEMGLDRLKDPKYQECRELAKEVIASPADDPTHGALWFDQSCEKDCSQYCTVYLGDGSSRAHYFARKATSDEQKRCEDKKLNPSGLNRYCCTHPRKKVYMFPELEITGKPSTGEEDLIRHLLQE